MEDRCIISEKFGINATDGRALITDEWPEYKLISFQDVSIANDVPTYQMYLIGDEGVETALLTTPPNPGDAWEDAYNVLLAKDESLVLPTNSSEVTLYLRVPNITGRAGVPAKGGC